MVLRVATVARRGPGGRSAAAAVLRWEGRHEARAIVRRLHPFDNTPPAYRALLLGLWRARRMGAHDLHLILEDPEVLGQLEGRDAVPTEAMVPWLQVRALLNAFRSVEFGALLTEGDPDHARAAAAAAAALNPPQPWWSDLPLWAGTVS